jgi:hypothetical protein
LNVVTLITVLRSGGRYNPSWVERLARGARKHVAGLDRVVCLTDYAHQIEGVETAALRHDWPTWWSKFEAFRPDICDNVNVLCDLDTLFLKTVTGLTSSGEPIAMEDYFLTGRLSTALMSWRGTELSFLYDQFNDQAAQWMQPGSCGDVPNSVHGDQVVVDHLLRRSGRLPRFYQRHHPALLNFYDPNKKNDGPILIFIGDAKPDNAIPSVKKFWESQ